MLRTIFLSLALVAFIANINAQADPVKAFFNKYKHTEEASNISLGGWMLDFAASHSDDDEAGSFIRKIDRLRVLSLPNSADVDPADLLSLRQSTLANNFEELMQVRDGSELVNIYLRENEEAITDVLIVVTDDTELTLVSLTGYLLLEDLKELDLDIEGTEALENVERGPRP